MIIAPVTEPGPVHVLWPGRLEQRRGSQHAVARQRLGGTPSHSSRSYSLTAGVAATQPMGNRLAPVRRRLAPELERQQRAFAAVASACAGSSA